MPSFESAPATHCHHVRSSGVRCGSLALRDKRYCYYHQRSRPLMVGSKNRGTPVLLALPLFEDAHAIQATLHSVVFHLLEGTMDHKTGSLLLYAMQIASSNLKHMKIETPAPGESVVDLPKLSEIPDPEPHQETSRLNSHTTRRTHFPYTPTVQDEYYDDIMRQTRELREHPEEVGKETFDPDLPTDLSQTMNSLEGDWVQRGLERLKAEEKKVEDKRAEEKEAEAKESAKKDSSPDDEPSSGKLPPGSIHGCASVKHRANGSRGLPKTPSAAASSRP